MVRPETARSTSSDAASAASARHVYDLHLERAYLRIVRAVAGPGRRPEAEGKLEAIDSQLAEAEHVTLPMSRLAARFDLGPVDRDFVWSAVALAADPRIAIHAVALVGSDVRRGLSLPLYHLLAHRETDGGALRDLGLRLAARPPIVRYHLLEVGEPELSVTSRTFRASARLISGLGGGEDLDPVLAGAGARVEIPQQILLDEAQRAALDRVAEALIDEERLVVILEGPAGSGRRTAAALAAQRTGTRVVALELRRIGASVAALEAALIALRREILLGGTLPVVAGIDDLVEDRPEAGGRVRALARLLDDLPGPVVLTSSRPEMNVEIERGLLRIEWPVPETRTRRALWRLQLGGAGSAIPDADLDHVAMHYVLGAGGIARGARSARSIARGRRARDAVEARDLIAGIHNNIAENLAGIARRVVVKQSWDDLVLSSEVMDQIHALIGRVRHAHRVYDEWGFGSKKARGMGVPVLFSGPPGTGKTMVAGIIARDLGLELLQVDLSQVVSKWVGETEKQLSRVFDAAEEGHALLLFDEADALFAKRTEVKGATDRYANLEVNYLLQRVEAFGGITILTTNLETSIDPALKRRLAAHVVFWPPDEEERERLWRRLLDTGTAPLSERLELDELARAYPDMTGANIRNAVLAAAFLAAEGSTEITQEHLERAARGEYRTMGRILR